MPSAEDQIVLALRRVSHAIDVWSRRLWREYGLTGPQLATLREILAGENTSPGTLATALLLSQPTVTGILARLEQRGLVTRERSATDRRSTVVLATELGRELAGKAPPLLRDNFRHELAKLPVWKQTDILSVLQHVATMMQALEVSEGPFFFFDEEKGSRSKKKRQTRKKPPEHSSR